jgi:hypothetical protein
MSMLDSKVAAGGQDVAGRTGHGPGPYDPLPKGIKAIKFTQTRGRNAGQAGVGAMRVRAIVRARPHPADKEGMKPTAVQYPQALTIAITDLARASARHGVTAYALSLTLAAFALLGAVFYKEITHTFGRSVMGVRAVTLWEVLFLAGAVVWLAAVALGLFTLPQKGRVRTFGFYSLAINVAVALLAACTLL